MSLWTDKRVKINQDEREQIREEERRKILKELRKEKHAPYGSHNSCKSLSEELRDYYEGRHRSHFRPHSHRREKERKPQAPNLKTPKAEIQYEIKKIIEEERRKIMKEMKKDKKKEYKKQKFKEKKGKKV